MHHDKTTSQHRGRCYSTSSELCRSIPALGGSKAKVIRSSRPLPGYRDAIVELHRAEQMISIMLASQSRQDEAIKRWYNVAPGHTAKDRSSRSHELLNHDRYQALQAASAFRRAARAALRAGKQALATGYEERAEQFDKKVRTAEQGLSDLHQDAPSLRVNLTA